MIQIKKVQNFLNLYQNGIIPIIYKPTRVTRKTATTMYHTLTNCFIETIFNNVIFKSDILNHFLIFFLVSLSLTKGESKTTFILHQLNHLRKNYMKLTETKQNL